ncbi:MAG: hypothetical protein M1840_001969 [Geoglossum simile]|nr:MAG: hypothetical protein M1840_001969 [Geoglossum simile]
MPLLPPCSPSLSASLQTLTFEGITGNEKDFKMVDEIWNQNANKYNTVKSPGSSYPLFISRRFGEPTHSGKRAGITVDLDVLLNCLSQLEDRLAIYTGFTLVPPAECTDAPSEHLKKLVKFLEPLQEINITDDPL